jgi:hypothetical protein
MIERVIRVTWREVTNYEADITVDEDAAKAALSDGGLEGFMAQHVEALSPADRDKAAQDGYDEILSVKVQP